MFTPSLGLTGIFTFNAPYDNLLNNSQEFKIIAIRTIHDFLSNGIDPYSTIYVPVGLSITDYDNDIKNNVPLITLASTGNEQVTLPLSYINDYPDSTYIKYQGKSINIDLNYLPLTYDLTSLVSDIKDVVYDRIAIDTTPTIIPTTPVTYKTDEVDEIITKLMENKPAVDRSYRTRYYEVSTSLETLQNENKMLLDRIASDKAKYDKLQNDYVTLYEKYNDCCEDS